MLEKVYFSLSTVPQAPSSTLKEVKTLQVTLAVNNDREGDATFIHFTQLNLSSSWSQAFMHIQTDLVSANGRTDAKKHFMILLFFLFLVHLWQKT